MIKDEDEVSQVSLRDMFTAILLCSFSDHGRTKAIVNNHLIISFIVMAILNKVGTLFLGFHLFKYVF